jgi:RNA polymerase sigma factor (sigma-70 family)
VEKPTLEQIISENARFVAGTLARFGVSTRDRDDVAQEVWRVVYRKLPCFDPSIAVRPEGAVRGWLAAICEILAANHRRARRRRAEHLSETWELDTYPSACKSAAARLSSGEEEARVLALVDELEAPRRAVVVAYDLEGMDMSAAAILLGIRVNTAWNRRRLALKDLRDAWRRAEPGKR